MSQNDLFELIGYKNKREQIDWLNSHGWIFQINRFGKPVVSLEYYQMRMGARNAESLPSTQPNWGALA